VSGINNIILIGMPGSGKSTIGKLLSEKINYDFIDTDKLIEIKEKLSVQEIFSLKGEAYFRSCEKEIIKELENESRKVISTGGGMPVYFDNLSKLKDSGIVIYLRVPTEEIYNRTKEEEGRPLLKQNSLEKLENLLNQRQHYYLKADLIIDNYMLTKEEICEIIIEKISDI